MRGAPPSDHEGRLAALPHRISAPLHAWARRTPRRPALIGDGRCWSFADFRQATREALRLLRGAGVRGGDRVLLVAENCPTLAALIMACSELDAWAAIVNARLSTGEIAAIRGHCAARRCVYCISVSPDAARHARTEQASFLDLPRLGRIAMGPGRRGQPERVAQSGATQVAALVYTTGTTGNPKAVMLTHRNLLFVAAASGARRRLTAEDLVYGVLPLSHALGLAPTFLGTLYAGGCTELVPRFRARHLQHALSEGGITVLPGVPAMYARILEHVRRHSGRLEAPALRYLAADGAPLGAATKAGVEALLGLPLHNGYGLTEASPSVAQTRIGRPAAGTDVGPPLEGVAVAIRDPRGRGLPAGEVGELWIRGPNVMRGYYRAPEATRAVLAADGWLNTQDLARLRPDGALSILGRSKDLILRSGFNVYPPEVEAVLNGHPGITRAAVVGRPVGADEEVVAYVQPAQGARLDYDALRTWLRERLSSYKMPAEIIPLADLPAAPSGKILRHRLRERAAPRGSGRG